MDNLKNNRVIAGIGIVGLILGVFLPYIKVSAFGYTSKYALIDYWQGVVILILAIVNLLFIFKDYVHKYIPALFESSFGKSIINASQKYSLIPTMISAGIALYLLLDGDVTRSSYAHYGIGFWILWIGVVCLVAHAFLYNGGSQVKQLLNNMNGQGMNQPMNNVQNNINNQGMNQPMNNVQNNINNQGMNQPMNVQNNMNNQGINQPMNVQNNMNSQGINQPMNVQNNMNNQGINQPMNNVQNNMDSQGINQPMNNTTKYCSNCGNQVDASMKYCSNCGNQI